jgi:glycosyltransferase involved in cell wall biosynthesis
VRSPPPALIDAVDVAALADFTERYGEPELGPVCVVIAAYREAESIGKVLDELPSTISGQDVSVLVVDDGSDDDTDEVALKHGAFVCRLRTNRGQGAALRLGYHLGTSYGAKYFVTTDADGQYDPDDIPRLLAPIFAGRADFVSGSRRLGRSYRGDTFRRTGVVVYAKAVSMLTRCRVTDPSFGLRAMRAEVPTSVILSQKQFQASELLIAAAMQGFRTTEVPCTMRRRAAGESRKGHDIVYGAHFGWVVLSTWWRERSRPSR